MIRDVPTRVREAAAGLACTSHFLVSLGVNRPDLTDAYWTYYYDEDIPFSRLSFPYKYSSSAAPPGCSSVQAEVVHSRFRPLGDPDAAVEGCIDAMLRCGILHNRDEIVAVDTRNVVYANVIFNLDRNRNLAMVHDYLFQEGVERCGRYGDWAYLWTDQSILSGERAGKSVRHALGMNERPFDAELNTWSEMR